MDAPLTGAGATHATHPAGVAQRTQRLRSPSWPRRRRMHTPLLLLLLVATLALSFHAAFVAAYTPLLRPAASSIESAFPGRQQETAASSTTSQLSSSGYASAGIPLQGTVISTSLPLLTQAAAAFRAQEDAEIDMAPTDTNEQAKAHFFTGLFDFAVAAFGSNEQDRLTHPSLLVLPLHGNAICPAYQLPSSVTNGLTLTLTGEALCSIISGRISTWDHPDIVASNPGMTLTTGEARGRNISLMLELTNSGTNDAIAAYCQKVDPDYPTLANWPFNPNAQFFNSLDLMNSGVSDTPFSFAITTLTNAAQISLTVGALLNAEGHPVMPTPNAMALTMFELATNGLATSGTQSYDLTRPHTMQAWPIMSMCYVAVDTESAVSTCANKRMLVKFLEFFYTSEVVRSIADTLQLAAFSSVLVSQLAVLDTLHSTMRCLGSPLVVSDAGSVGQVASNALGRSVLDLFASFYLTIDYVTKFVTATQTEALSVQRVALAENSLALVDAAALSDADMSLLADSNSALIPAFVVGVAPTFYLPDAVRALARDTERTKDLNLPALYPLRLDMDTLTLMYIGVINSWVHPRLLALNPQLDAWFTQSGAPVSLNILVGSTAAGDAISGAKLLFSHMRLSPLAREHPWAFVNPTVTVGPASNPFLAIRARANTDPTLANLTIIDVESRLATKLLTMPGHVSYRPVQQKADNTVDWEMVSSLPVGADAATHQRTTYKPAVSTLRRCGVQFAADAPAEGTDEKADASLISFMSKHETQRQWVNLHEAEVGCWPLSTMLSFAVKLTYSSAAGNTACQQGLHALEFINYMQSTPILSGSAERLGLIRLADSPLIERLTSQLLHTSQCDGETLMIILPNIYSVSPSVRSFSMAIVVIGALVMLVSAGVVLTYRHKVVIRSSSFPFLCAILLGMAMLLVAGAAWTETPLKGSCAGFLWLVDLGFMLLFTPLFAKTWRVWRIFSGSHLRIVKISNEKLMMGTALIILCDILLVAVWQGVAPLEPIQYSRMIDNKQHVFTHCSVSGSGPGLVFVGLVGAEKGMLLLFGAVMAFSTRNVKGAFNESVAISWSIYNTLMSLIIGVAIIVFVNAVEDTLIVVVLVLLLWIVGSAWALLFVPKFQTLAKSDEAMLEQSRSEITMEKSNGFSFASLAVMTTGQVRAYYGALKLQVNKAERLLHVPLTAWGVVGAGQGGGGGVIASASGYDSLNARESSSPASRALAFTGKSSGLGSPTGSPPQQMEDSAYAALHDRAPVGKDRDGARERGVLKLYDASLTSSTYTASLRKPAGGAGATATAGGHGLHARAPSFTSTSHSVTRSAVTPCSAAAPAAGSAYTFARRIAPAPHTQVAPQLPNTTTTAVTHLVSADTPVRSLDAAGSSSTPAAAIAASSATSPSSHMIVNMSSIPAGAGIPHLAIVSPALPLAADSHSHREPDSCSLISHISHSVNTAQGHAPDTLV